MRRRTLRQEAGTDPCQRPSAQRLSGPWQNRPGLDEIGAAVTGLFCIEGTPTEPRSPPIIPICDNVMGWLGTVGVLAALRRRAIEGGSYRVTVSLSRTVLWLLSLGIFDKDYARRRPDLPTSARTSRLICSPRRRRWARIRASQEKLLVRGRLLPSGRCSCRRPGLEQTRIAEAVEAVAAVPPKQDVRPPSPRTDVSSVVTCLSSWEPSASWSSQLP